MQHIDSQESWQAIAPLSQMVTRFAKLLWQSLFSTFSIFSKVYMCNDKYAWNMLITHCNLYVNSNESRTSKYLYTCQLFKA